METKKNDVQKAQENVLVNNVIEKTKEVKLTLQQQLEKELQRLTLKKELADKRAFFILKKDALLKYKEFIVNDLGQMETKFAKISFIGINEYGREDEKININNPQFVAKYIDYLVADINVFVSDIEKKLLTEPEA